MTLRLYLIAFLTIVCIVAKSQVSVGLRESQYAFAAISFCNHWSTKIEESLYSEPIDYQRIRLYAGYSIRKERFSGELLLYVSTLWNGKYKDYGAKFITNVELLSFWDVDLTINPHFDTGLSYKTCYSMGTGLKITKDISFLLHYSTIPEYRISEKRIRLGARFRSKKLSVTPELSISTGKIKKLRTLCSMQYVF